MGAPGPGGAAEGGPELDAQAGFGRLYGRRIGRPLRPGQQERLARLLPALALPATLPPDLRSLFAAPVSEVWLEIGFGGGEHLTAQAAARPDVGLIGVEPFVNGIAKALAAIEAQGLANIRLLHGDARPLLARLPEASLTRIFVLFPDPWRKARHHRRRLIQHDTLALLARALADGGELRLATDHADYLVWMLEHLRGHPDLAWTAGRAADWLTRPPDWPPTRYEEKALAAGRIPVFLRFRRRRRDGAP
ncbi:MAG: tRNA (guanosine(46)-N7)-methyltransferase TrmB [Thalassobaculales bacterium]